MTARYALRVFDRLPSGSLVGLESLLGCLLAVQPAAVQWRWCITPGAWGHGAFVCSIEDRLSAGERVTMSSAELLEHLRPADEYFEDVRLSAEECPVRLAVVDSSFLELVACSDVVGSCAARYRRTEVLKAGD